MLRELRLRDFRCFEELVFQPEPELNFLIGPNAQGKTSILEAACVLLRLQSPRASSLAEAVRFQQAGFGLDGHWDDRHLQVKFVGALKAFTLDSKPQTFSADYLAVARVAWISNDDLSLVTGSPSQRRRYLDFLGAQAVPEYLRQLRAYERTLQSRNALLKQNRPAREIAAFDAPLIKAGQALLEARRRLCEDLQPQCEAALRQIAGAAEILRVAYRPGCGEDFAAALAASREEELRLRVTVAGPHRDDILITLQERPAGVFASEGQQRSVALALKLAQARLLEDSARRPPLYLIDDVFGELDPARRNNLLAALPASAQKLITSTNLAWLEERGGGAIYDLHEGRLTRRT